MKKEPKILWNFWFRWPSCWREEMLREMRKRISLPASLIKVWGVTFLNVLRTSACPYPSVLTAPFDCFWVHDSLYCHYLDFPPIFPTDRAEPAFSLFGLLRQSLEIADAQNTDESMIQRMTETWNWVLDIQVWKLKADTELGAMSSVLTKPWGQSENLRCEKRVGWGNPENVSLREGQKKKKSSQRNTRKKSWRGW